MSKALSAAFGMGLAILVAAGCKPATESKEPAGKSPLKQPTEGPAAAATLPKPSDPDKVLVEVDGVKLTQGEVDRQISRVFASAGPNVPPERLAMYEPQLRKQAVDQFVMRTVLKNEADRREVEVTEQEVTDAIVEIEANMPEGQTLAEALQRDGMSNAEFKSNLTTELKIRKMVEGELKTAAEPSEADVAAFYEKEKARFERPESVHARHILIRTDANDSEEVRAEKKAKAESLREQLVAGADFAELARQHSDCPSKERGGDLGEFSRGQMVKPFEDAAFSQEPNAISPVVETSFGYHIIQTIERKDAAVTPIEEVREDIAGYLKQKGRQEAFENFMNGLKSKASITYAEGAAPMPSPFPIPVETETETEGAE